MSDSLWPHGLQHTRLPCPSPSPEVCSNSCPLNWWCRHHLILCCPFSSCPQSFQHQSLFQWVLESGGQSTGVLASASVLPMNIQGWFPLGLIGLPRGETQNLSTITGSDSCWLWDVMSKLLNLTSLFFPFQHSNYRYLLCSAHNHCKDSARTIQMLF